MKTLLMLFATALTVLGSVALCISSAKQVGVAVLMYQGDYDDRYPPGTKWRTLVDPYRRGKPTETSGEPDQTLRCPEAIQPWTYALNSALSGYDGDKVADSMATVLVFDSGGKVPDLTGGVGDFALRHSGKGTVVFGDGRTVLADAPQLRWHP